MKLELTFKQTSTRDGLYAYALHISAVSADSADSSDPRVFVFRRSTPTFGPGQPQDGMVDDEFFNVATPVDMYDIPPLHPDPEHGMPYFRDSELDLWFRNLEDLDRAKAEISADVASLCDLCDTFSNPENFIHTETAEFE